jgi:rhomboid protease GluP
MDKRRMCPHCRAFISSSDRVCPYCQEAVGQRAAQQRDTGAVLAGFIPQARFTTIVILVINFGLYLATTLYSLRQGNADAMWNIDIRTLFDFGARNREAILLGKQWWRLVTAGFLHGGLMHILMNSWVLFDLGAEVEAAYGTSRMLVFYFISTVCGFLASTFFSSAVISVGASAGLFGLIGAMIAFGMQHQSALGAAIRGLYVRWAIYGLLFGLLPFFRVDNAAHIGGIVSGFAVAYLAGLPRVSGSLREQFWRGMAAACIVLTVLSFLKMYLWFAHSGT